jgi:hypothetical protein
MSSNCQHTYVNWYRFDTRSAVLDSFDQGLELVLKELVGQTL